MACFVLSSLAVDATARAYPVRPGHFEEVPYGVDRSHPYPTGGATTERASRVRSSGPTEQPSERWATELHVSRPSSPAVARDGQLYVASAGGLHALLSDGRVAWSEQLGFLAATPSITPSGDIVVGTQSGEIVVVAPNGEVRFRVALGGAVRGSPLVLPDGSTVVSTFDRVLHRIDATGRRVFRAPLRWPTNGPIAWDGRDLWFTAADRLLRYSQDGVPVRSTSAGAPALTGPSVATERGFWILGQDMTVRFGDSSGRIVAEATLGVPVSPMMTLAVGRDGSVRVPTRGDTLVCIDVTGSERWRVSGEGSFLGGALLDVDDRTFAVTDRGVLLGIDVTGEVMWRVRMPARSDVSPVLGTDGTLYVADIRGTVRAWR